MVGQLARFGYKGDKMTNKKEIIDFCSERAQLANKLQQIYQTGIMSSNQMQGTPQPQTIVPLYTAPPPVNTNVVPSSESLSPEQIQDLFN